MMDRIRRRLAEPADRRIAHHRLEIADCDFVHGAGRLEQRGQFGRAFPAGRALPKTLIVEEFEKIERRGLHIVMVRENHDRVRSNKRAHLGKLAAEVERYIRHRSR